jgi:hypothetical protein
MGKVRWQDLDEYDRAGSQKFKRVKKGLDEDVALETFSSPKRVKKYKRK